MSVEFTKEQQRVIDLRGKSMLVSAAAGSGKTAVLVERIIRMVLDKENPIDIDSLLVVTFTEKAATEMRERIGEAIDRELYKDPENEHLQRQSALLYKAQISTIHSFCLNLIRNNFNDIGLDPAFRVADTLELKLLSEDVLTELFESRYSEKNEAFLNLVEFYSRGISDDALRSYVLKLSEFAEGYPWQYEWLDDCISQYNITNVTEMSKTPWMQYFFDYAENLAEDMLKLSQRAVKLCREPRGPVRYTEVILNDSEAIEGLVRAAEKRDFDALSDAVNALSFGRIPPKAGEDVSEELKERVKALREEYKAYLTADKTGSLKRFLKLNPEAEAELLRSVYPYVSSLCALTKEYMEAFKEKKLEKGIISFSDMEHYALSILYESRGNEHIPSARARELRASYSEILMDEYQDCNRVQELIISSIASEEEGRYNRFMVGDVKQSIYKFRLSSPELFIDKYNRYKTVNQTGQEENPYERIDLHKNFRSRESVINTVNDLFSQIMHAPIGGIEYDQEAYLVEGASYPPLKTQDIDSEAELSDKTELLLIEKNNDSNETKGIQEAYLIADRIKQLMKHHYVTDKETGLLRRTQYKDIVILLRAMTDVAYGLKRVLSREGIPAYLSMGTGFYDTREIQQIIQLLKVIDNPMQDIPLYGTLTSYFGGFSDEYLASVLAGADEGSLYSRLRAVSEKEMRLKKFFLFIEGCRAQSEYTPIHELIIKLVNETGYLNYVTALAGGAQRRANVLLLINKAAAFENTSYKGLFHFVRYLSHLKRTLSDEGEADVLGENADVVRIMTIHKSKGLEFPICFVAGVHKKFNADDVKGSLIMDMDLGIGSAYVDTDKRIMLTPLYKKVMALKLKQDMTGEELRVLYVAMTRAKEKLIITGVIDDKKAEKISSASGEDREGMSYSETASADSFLSLLKPMYKEAFIVKGNELFENEIKEASDVLTQREKLLYAAAGAGESPEYKALAERMGQKYAYPELKELILKTSVSELKKAYLDFEETAELYEKRESGSLSGTDRGSAYHKIMELLDFNNKDIKSQFDLFINNGRISKEWAEAVSIQKIEAFMNTGLSERMAEAQAKGLLKREQPFVLGISADRVDKKFPADETVLLQGIIDAFFIEDGEIVLLDYKTDVIENGLSLMKRYHVQLEYYAEALERILGMKVKERLLYSFYLNEAVGE